MRYPTKKQSFSLEEDCFFVGYLKIFWPFLFWNGFSFCFTSTVNYFKVVSILRKKPSNLCSFQWSYLLDFYEWHLNVESHRIILTLILSFFILHSITQKSHKNVPFRKLPRKIATENCSNWKSQKNLRVLSKSFWRRQ